MLIAKVEDVNIVSSVVEVVEAGVPVWDVNTSYAVDDEVQINGTTNKKYKAIVANTGVDPLIDVQGEATNGTTWFFSGYTNYAKPFDELNSERSERNDEISYVFSVSDIDLLLLTGVVAKNIEVIVTNLATNTIVFDETYEMFSRGVYDWFDWTYAETEYKSTFSQQIPPVYDATLEIKLTNAAHTVEVGHICYGRSKDLGLTLVDPSPKSSMRSISSKTRDIWGNIKTRKKQRYKRATINCLIDSASIDIIEDRIEGFVDTACIIVGDERDKGYKSLSILGELKDHDMPISVSKTKYTLEVEGYL